MLTDIEWWGGLILIWLAVSFYWVNRLAVEDDDSFSLRLVIYNLGYFSCTALMSLYFYTLGHLDLKYLYLGSLGFGALVFLYMLWGEFFSTRADDIDKEDIQPQAVAEAEAEDTEEDEEGWTWTGRFILYTPNLICLGFGAYKAQDFVDLLPI